MGKGIIKEILTNDEGEYVGEYRVELQKDTSRAKFMIEALNSQLTAITDQIPILEGEITELERAQDILKYNIDKLIWLVDCVKGGFGDQRMLIIQDPANPTTPPINNIADTKIPEIPRRVIKKPRKPGEVKPDYTGDFIVNDQKTRLRIEELHRDPVDGQITPDMISEAEITSNRDIVDLLTPVNDSPDRDIIAVTTKSADEQYPTQICAVDVSDKTNIIPGTPLTELPGIIEANMVYIPITNTPVVITMMVGGEARIIDCSDPANLLETPLPLPGEQTAVGLDPDGNVILMNYDKTTGEATLYDLDPADLGNPTQRGSETIPGSVAYFEQILIMYHNGEDPGTYAHFVASTYYGNEQADTGMTTMNIEDKDNPVVVSRFQDFANNHSYYYGLHESEYSEDILYILESTDESLEGVKTLQDQNRQVFDFIRKRVRHWRTLIVDVSDPADPQTVGIIESSNTSDPNAVKEKPTSPTDITETDDVLVIVGETTEP